MKAAAVLLFAAGVTTAATLPVHHDIRGLAIRQDVAAEVIDDSEAADANAEDVAADDAEAADAEAADAEAADAEADNVDAENVGLQDLNVDDNVDDLAVNLNDIGSLGVQDLLGLNLNDFIDFNLLGLDPALLALGINNIFDGFFPGFVTVDALGVLDAGQLLLLMIVSQTLFNAEAFGLLNQAQLINLFASGFVGNVLPFGFAGQVPVNLAALGLGGFGGAFSQDAFNSGVDVNAEDLSANDISSSLDVGAAAPAASADVASATDAADAAAESDSGFTAEEVAGFTR